MARANKPELDRWVNDLVAQYLPFEYEKGKTGELQLAMRPIQLYEIVFPEKELPKILGAIQPYDKRMSAFSRILRGLMGLRKIPQGIQATQFKTRHPHVSVIGVGIKKDRFIDGIEEI